MNTSKWKPFLLSDLFEIRKGKRLTKENQTEGDTVFIGATATNNGITSYVGQEPIHQGNTISITYNGSVGEAFYQPKPFWASDDVNVLYPLGFKLNEKLALFFCTVLRHEKQMWSYARKWNKEKMKNTAILLPVDESNKPDFEAIERFMDTLNNDVSNIPDYFLTDGYEKACWYLDNIDQEKFEQEYSNCAMDKPIKLSDRVWKLFKIKDIIDSVHNGKSYNATDLTVAVDGADFISYVTRTDNHNGISMYVQQNDYEGLEKGNAITIGDTTATIFFQSRDFITGPHIIVLRAKWLNVYTASFIIALLNNEKYRYPVFGRAYTKNLIEQTELSLPVKVGNEAEPDYQFMEDYIKSRPFSSKIL